MPEEFYLQLNGLLAGILSPLFVWITNQISISFQPLVIGIFYAMLLWLLTLVPIHKAITGFLLSDTHWGTASDGEFWWADYFRSNSFTNATSLTIETSLA